MAIWIWSLEEVKNWKYSLVNYWNRPDSQMEDFAKTEYTWIKGWNLIKPWERSPVKHRRRKKNQHKRNQYSKKTTIIQVKGREIFRRVDVDTSIIPLSFQMEKSPAEVNCLGSSAWWCCFQGLLVWMVL